MDELVDDLAAAVDAGQVRWYRGKVFIDPAIDPDLRRRLTEQREDVIRLLTPASARTLLAAFPRSTMLLEPGTLSVAELAAALDDAGVLLRYSNGRVAAECGALPDGCADAIVCHQAMLVWAYLGLVTHHHVYVCSSCGEAMMLSSNRQKRRCPFCNAAHAMTGKVVFRFANPPRVGRGR